MAKRIVAGKRSGGNPIAKKKQTSSGGTSFKGPLLSGSRAGGRKITAGKRSGKAPGTR